MKHFIVDNERQSIVAHINVRGSINPDDYVTKEEAKEEFAPSKPSILPPVDTTNKETVQRASIFVEENGQQKQITLQQVKEMNTKIISADTEEEIIPEDLTAGDYIYIKN